VGSNETAAFYTEEFNREHADEIERVCRMPQTNDVAEAVYSAQLQAASNLDGE